MSSDGRTYRACLSIDMGKGVKNARYATRQYRYDLVGEKTKRVYKAIGSKANDSFSKVLFISLKTTIHRVLVEG